MFTQRFLTGDDNGFLKIIESRKSDAAEKGAKPETILESRTLDDNTEGGPVQRMSISDRENEIKMVRCLMPSAINGLICLC